MGLVMLAAGCGTELIVEANGENTETTLEPLVAERFGEDT